MWVASLKSGDARSHYQPSLPHPDNQKWPSSAQRESHRVGGGAVGGQHVVPRLPGKGTRLGSSKCLLHPEKGLSDGRPVRC